MSLHLSILASGSSGNCGVLRCGDGGVVLIDCGIGPRTAAARMRGLGVGLADIRAICVTHLDHDHFNACWVGEIIRRQIPVYCARRRCDELAARTPDERFQPLVRPFDDDLFWPALDLCADPLHVRHDREGCHAFVFESNGVRLGYATDLGRVETALLRRFAGVNLLAIESNYDPQMQRDSGRPWFLQQRIMGGRGHLSNGEALAAVRRLLDDAQRNSRPMPAHIVLLHRSRQCNCPDRLRAMFSADERIAARLVLAEQHRATGWLAATAEPTPGQQLTLQWA